MKNVSFKNLNEKKFIHSKRLIMIIITTTTTIMIIITIIITIIIIIQKKTIKLVNSLQFFPMLRL